MVLASPTDPRLAGKFFWPEPPNCTDTKHDPDLNKYIRGYCVIEDDIMLFDVNNNGDYGDPLKNFRLQMLDDMVITYEKNASGSGHHR